MFILSSLICTLSSKFLLSIGLVQLHSRYLWYAHNAKIYMAFSACDKLLSSLNYQGLVCSCNFGAISYSQPSAIFPCLNIEAFIRKLILKQERLLLRKSVIRYQLVTPPCLEVQMIL